MASIDHSSAKTHLFAGAGRGGVDAWGGHHKMKITPPRPVVSMTLSDEDRDRLADIVKLQPTKNGELQQ